MINKKLLSAILMVMIMASGKIVTAAEMDHSKHMAQPMQKDPGKHDEHQGAYYGVTPSEGSDAKLQQLNKIPTSGRSREATFDGRYNMESTSVINDLDSQCAHASRGLVMLDNATWEKCGGKPEGASKGPGYYPALPPWNKEGTGKVEPMMDHSSHDMN